MGIIMCPLHQRFEYQTLEVLPDRKARLSSCHRVSKNHLVDAQRGITFGVDAFNGNDDVILGP
jgi:hypothetical protein